MLGSEGTIYGSYILPPCSSEIEFRLQARCLSVNFLIKFTKFLIHQAASLSPGSSFFCEYNLTWLMYWAEQGFVCGELILLEVTDTALPGVLYGTVIQ